MIERLLDQMRREGVESDHIERVSLIGEKHIGQGLFYPVYRVRFTDQREEFWYSRLGQAWKLLAF